MTHDDSESEARFRTMADCAPVLVWMAETDGECSFFNRGWLAFTGRTMEQEVGVGWASGIHPEDFQAAMHLYLDSFVERREFRTEYRLRRHDGEYRWILDHGVPRFGPDGKFAGYIGSCIDITDMREANAALSRALHDREVLLKEIHHRVKNNLQILSSLHSLQSRRVTDPRAREVLRDNDARVRAIALVHDLLYRSSSNFSTVALRQYAGEIATTIQQVSGRRDVRIEVDTEGVGLGLDLAIPCGLIINELVTNAMKHAFPDERAGKVVIRAAPVPAGESGRARVRLVVSDDGVGLPPGWDTPGDRRSLGLQLVATLAKQLGATMEVGGGAVGSGPGTTFALTFDTGSRP